MHYVINVLTHFITDEIEALLSCRASVPSAGWSYCTIST